VEIKHPKGLLGWSDGDVLLHAVIDAVIGAMGEGDIGRHFPPGDLRYKGISSLRLMEFVQELLRVRGFAINNIDATVVAQEPKLFPYIEEMKGKIAGALRIDPSQINIKGKTEEGLGFTGKKQGIAAYAICLIHKDA
jgi:2-C-methyl-D-erythritol 2,4-cyclodiphosphate synthase